MESEGEFLHTRHDIMHTTAYGSVEGYVMVDDILGSPVARMEHVEVDEAYRHKRSGKARRLVALFAEEAIREGAVGMEATASHPAVIPVIAGVFGREHMLLTLETRGALPQELRYEDAVQWANEMECSAAQYEAAGQDVPDDVRTGVQVVVDLTIPGVHKRITAYIAAVDDSGTM
jgi:hypothetical protein